MKSTFLPTTHTSYVLPGNFRFKAIINPDGKMEEDWQTVEANIGHIGNKRNTWFRQLNNKYGPLCWRPAWMVEEGKYVPFKAAIEDYYEQAYFEYLEQNPNLAQYLSQNAFEVYDTNVRNIESGTNYYRQGKKSNHFQDIAIRRVLAKLGLKFQGDEFINIRSNSTDEIGRALSPGSVPFHKPEMINDDSTVSGWWQDGSIEDFWQRNKVIQVSPMLQDMDVEQRLSFVEWINRAGNAITSRKLRLKPPEHLT